MWIPSRGEKLVNRRLAYVAVSRGRYDAQLYNDKTHLTEQLSRHVSHRSAMEPGRAQQPAAAKIEPSSTTQAQAVASQAQSIGPLALALRGALESSRC
jgi:hypothetical protein